MNIEQLPLGVLVLDDDDVILDANEGFISWFGTTGVVGRRLTDVLTPADDFLAGASPAMMAHPSDPMQAVLVSREPRPRGSILTVMEAADRYAAGIRLRDSFSLAARTRTRLELIIESSVALAEAADDDALARILAETAARAYVAEESVVYLSDGRSEPVLVAGSDPFAATAAGARLLQGAMAIQDVVMVSGADAADAIDPELGEVMRATGVHAFIAAPLMHDDLFLGLFACTFHHPRQFDEEAAPLATALANQAAQALTTMRLQRRLAYAAMHDEVTGLPNRRKLEELGSTVYSTALFIDLDGFKAVNDDAGHEVGDRVLREVARRLESGVRADDVVARYGGDEFVVICGAADPSGAVDVAHRLLALVAAPYPFLPPHLGLSASIGIAVSDGVEPGTIDTLLRDADRAMYDAKRAGGNRVSLAVGSRESVIG